MQLVFEHELAHMLIMAYCEPPTKMTFGRQTSDAHGNAHFKQFVRSMFGHTATKHQLLSGDADAQRKVPSNDCPGAPVIVTDPRSGTSWTGAVLHALRSNALRITIRSTPPFAPAETRVPIA